MKLSDVERISHFKLVEIARQTTAVEIPIFSRRLGVIVKMPDDKQAAGYAKSLQKRSDCSAHQIGRYVMLRH